jgi:predicted ferric reductase
MGQFKVKPGQFMILRFVARKYWWQAHPFSLSMPTDGKFIRITPKSVGDFTSLIPHLPLATPVIIEGPFGTFTREAAKKDKILFIAGGIGITPVRALIEEMAKEGKNVVLFYSNKTKAEIVFKNEIDMLSKKFRFPVHYFLSQEKADDYYYGRITAESITARIKNIKEYDIFICGPGKMTDSMRKALILINIPQEQIHFEKFTL